jgi:hypothetical protein
VVAHTCRPRDFDRREIIDSMILVGVKIVACVILVGVKLGLA